MNKNHEEALELERLTIAITEAIAEFIFEQRLTQSEIARRMGRSRQRVWQILCAERSPTLRTLSRMLFAMGARMEVTLVPIPSEYMSE